MRRISRTIGLLAALILSFGHSLAQDLEATDSTEVIIGMYINDIHAVDLSSHSYGVDLYLWFRWVDPEINPINTFEFMNPFDPEALVKTVIYDEPVPQPDGSLYQIIRAQGLFTSKFPVNRYPFDRQNIVIAVEDSQVGVPQQRYVADKGGLVVNQEITLPGYEIHPSLVVIRDKQYKTAFGDLAQPDISAYSRAEFLVPVSRPVMPGIFKIFVPIFLIILSAGFALLLDPDHVEARVGLAITALLTLVAMQFTMLSGLPEVAYLTLIDQVFLASFFYVLIVIGLIVYMTRIDQQGSIRGEVGAMAKIVNQGPATAISVTAAYVITVVVLLSINLY